MEEEGEEEDMEGEVVDHNFRLELMKVLQQQNAAVSPSEPPGFSADSLNRF